MENKTNHFIQFKNSIRGGFYKTFDFGGISTRSEFWYWMLFGLILIVFSFFLDDFLGFTLISEIILLVFHVPLQSLFFRRLHDTGVSGWWILGQVTVVGIIPLYLWLIRVVKPKIISI